MQQLTWLHLSDIHFHPKLAWRDAHSRGQLLDYLKQRFSENPTLFPDLIFCTGDIAFGQLATAPMAKQYAEAAVFFDALLAVCGKDGVAMAKQRLFVVPGNHDINRNSVDPDAQATLRQKAVHSKEHEQEINQRFQDQPLAFENMIKRLAEYDEFIKSTLPHQHDADNRMRYARLVEIDGMQIGIAGLNSAWSCYDDQDDRMLWLAAEWQLNQTKTELAGARIRIALMHHPIDHLNQSERRFVQQRLAGDFHFFLHGHSHNPWVTPGLPVTVNAGAIGAADADEFGVNFVQLDFDKGKGSVHLHKYDKIGWMIAPVPTHAPDAVWKFDLPPGLHGIGTSGPVADDSGPDHESHLHNKKFFPILPDGGDTDTNSQPGIFNLPAARLAPFYADPLGNLPLLHARLNAHGASAILAQATVAGMGGVGKTQLALQFCHAHRLAYAGVWWLRAETQALLAEDCHAFCVAVGIDPTSAPQRAMRAWLTRQPRGWLLVYDNAENEADLIDFLPVGGPHHVLITSRQPHWRGVESFGLDVWSADQALVFLRKHLPNNSEADLRRLSDSLGGLPLALEQACAYLLKMQGGPAAVARYAAEIDASTRGLSLLERNDSALANPVLATLSLAFARLGAPARALLDLCGWLGPEAIPEFLFTDAPELLPKALQTVARDPARWRETVAELSGFALCKVEWSKAGATGAQGAGDEEWSALGLHRLTQAAVRAATLRHGGAARTGAAQGKEKGAGARAKRAGVACQRVFALLFAAFPKEPDHWRHWPRCQALAAHVQRIEEWHRQGWIGDDRYAWLLSRLARYWQAGPALYGEARRLYEASLAIRRERLGAEHPDTLTAINNLADLLWAQGDFAAARPLQEQVLECRTRVQGPEHPDTLTAMHNLSLTLQNLNELQAARRLQETALEIRISTPGPEHPDTLLSMLALARSLSLQGELAEARVRQERALPICSRVLGADHPVTLGAMQNLASTLWRQSALVEARVLQEQVLQSRRALLGPAHPRTLAAMLNLATILHRQDEAIAARDLIDQALALYTRVLGPQHPDTLTAKAWWQAIHDTA